jgi:hypothetical protein
MQTFGSLLWQQETAAVELLTIWCGVEEFDRPSGIVCCADQRPFGGEIVRTVNRVALAGGARNVETVPGRFSADP